MILLPVTALVLVLVAGVIVDVLICWVLKASIKSVTFINCSATRTRRSYGCAKPASFAMPNIT